MYQKVRYQKVRNAYRIESEGSFHIVPVTIWNSFLNRYGSPIVHEMTRVAGLANVESQPFNQFIKTRQVNMNINHELTQLITDLSKGISDIDYERPTEQYMNEVLKKIDRIQKRLSFFQHNCKRSSYESKTLIDQSI